MENIVTPFVGLPSCSPAAVFGAALSPMPAVSSWNHVQTPATGRGTDRSVPTFDNYMDDAVRVVRKDEPTAIGTDASAAALAKQGAPPRGEPR